jgi:hypothetical protein
VKPLLSLLLVSLVLAASCSRPDPKPAAEAPPDLSDEAISVVDILGRKQFTEADRPELIVGNLIDPGKLDTLKGDRAANTRLRKVAYWLETARRSGREPGGVIDAAQTRTGYACTPRAREDRKALLRNLTILERLGCLTDDGMAKLRAGHAPTITRGPYAGDVVEVDHIIPRAVAPELDEKLFNLEFMPATMNRKKSDGIGRRQKALASEWEAMGLLSPEAAIRVETT